MKGILNYYMHLGSPQATKWLKRVKKLYQIQKVFVNMLDCTNMLKVFVQNTQNFSHINCCSYTFFTEATAPFFGNKSRAPLGSILRPPHILAECVRRAFLAWRTTSFRLQNFQNHQNFCDSQASKRLPLSKFFCFWAKVLFALWKILYDMEEKG